MGGGRVGDRWFEIVGADLSIKVMLRYAGRLAHDKHLMVRFRFLQVRSTSDTVKVLSVACPPPRVDRTRDEDLQGTAGSADQAVWGQMGFDAA